MSRLTALIIVLPALLLTGCSLSGTVVDRSEFAVQVGKMQLAGDPALKVYHGGALHLIPLESIKTLEIDGEESMNYGGEFFMSASITLKDGTRKVASGRNSDKRSFVSVNNTITGKSSNGVYSISVDNIIRLEVD
ncbi:hypothetical protein CHISP_2619 [Chitinispirillum alkaliphilum]|nr:hypothetical protein CHISP_2619 [Chitinispirillum alkaliphilum]